MSPAGIEILLHDGPAGGSAFITPAFGWPPPEEVRVVTGGKKGPELLDLPDDEVCPGEQLHLYRRESHGTYRAGRSGGFFGSYRLARSAPVPEPTLFEAGIRGVS